MCDTHLTELFGFLKHPYSIEFDGGSVKLTDSYERELENISNKANSDGYIYPPQVSKFRQGLDFDTGQMKQPQVVPNSKKPSPVLSLPASHVLHINNPINEENIRFEDAGLLIHLIGFLFGTRLQFSDWRFDGKVPFEYKNYLFFSHDALSDFVSHVYQKWRILDSEQRKYYINIVYMHGKAKSCEWEYDQFCYQYMVFDAIYRFYVNQGNEKIGGHKNRISGLCNFFNIEYDHELIYKIHTLRNKLFHEALWYGGTPGHQKKQHGSHLIPKCLERLNSQLIVAIIGYTNNYSKSKSWSNLNFRGEVFDKFIY